jgi:hypothetical protein
MSARTYSLADRLRVRSRPCRIHAMNFDGQSRRTGQLAIDRAGRGVSRGRSKPIRWSTDPHRNGRCSTRDINGTIGRCDTGPLTVLGAFDPTFDDDRVVGVIRALGDSLWCRT